MVAGRPRTISPPKNECIQLGEDLIKWVQVEDEKNPRLLFSEFYAIEKKIIRKEWKEIIQIKEFRPYYEQAQAILAKRCINGTMEKSFGQRFIRLYSRDLAEEENETAKYNADLKKSSDNVELLHTFAQFAEFVEQKKHSNDAKETIDST